MRALISRKIVLIVGLAVVAVITVAALAFDDSLARFLASPRAPFQITTPPAAPEYGARGAWLLWPDKSADADVFYVHSTSYYRRRRWNASINHEKADRTRRQIAAPNESGPFESLANIYAPRYREATLYALFTHKYDGLAARELAFADVERAFRVFLAERDPERPIILVGYDQGGLHVLGLLHAHFQGEFNPLRHRLVAAYVIGAPTPAAFIEALKPSLPACASAAETGCLVSYVDYEKRFDEEMTRIRRRTLAWNAEGKLVSGPAAPTVCINPLSWTIDDAYHGPDEHAGAASATGIARGKTPPPIRHAVGARCDRGILVVDTPRQKYLRRSGWFGAKWKAQPFNLFYFDLKENAALRLAALQEKLTTEPEMLEPIGESVDLGDSPINKAPR